MKSPIPQPDLQRQLKQRLMHLSPRGFELFAGDLLVYVGLQNVTVTRYVGDGGIDARGDIVTHSGIVRIPTGVQVKRHKQNVQRSDIDRFIGALSGEYAQGIFITTAGYAPQALNKATYSFPRVTPINGNQVIKLMLEHQLGFSSTASASQLDEMYFDTFEQQAAQPTKQVREQSEMYGTVPAEDDLITLRALSYALRIDTTTVRRWIAQRKLTPDTHAHNNGRDAFFFRRARIEHIRNELIGLAQPSSEAEWHQEFLDFARSRNLTKSYKPVFLRALLKLVDHHGEVDLDALAAAFLEFYIQRKRHGLPAEFGVALLNNPEAASLSDVKQLIVKYPLDRFKIKGFLEHIPGQNIVRFAPQLWRELRYHELLEVQASVDEQIRYYYARYS